MVPELAEDYAAFLKVDLTKELSAATESVEDMLTRLEEFQSLIQMVEADGFQAVNTLTTEILGKKDELKQLGDRIDGLECLVTRVKGDMDKLESLLNTAEAEANASDGAPLLKALGSLFTKKPVVDIAGPSRTGQSSTFTSPDLFSADKVFTSPPESTLQQSE
ncbi:Biogenesis of lysosome-related organelles complex 1 subunit 4 [Frankliniella fusca]|uniref:Biogenesis of lysosome-related organelles complex 1 subunit 4 n=1 Tax=Frankliniella fusca TaxID=407009 RepID=A0AAE1LGE1_9NEOP|nr:Biogenesis of lysosome-related organelles complex 1 subunit 4 [Frankliniella fusca]